MCGYGCPGTKQGLCDDSLGELLLLPFDNAHVCAGLQEGIHKFSKQKPTHTYHHVRWSFSSVVTHRQNRTLCLIIAHIRALSETTVCIILSVLYYLL